MHPLRLWSGATERSVEIVTINTATLGDRSYLAHDGQLALVIDPQRDIGRVLAVAAERGVRVTDVFETHIHNDYLTGGLALARATGAAYHVSAADEVAFDRVPVRDGDVIDVSPFMRIRVIATPGHTFTHLSYALEAAGRPRAVFTGGRTCSAPRMPPSWRTPSTRRRTAWRTSCRRMRTSIRRTGSAASARPPRPRASPPPPRPSAGRGGSTRRWSWLSSGTSASCWPGWMPTPPTMRTWARRTRPALLART